jgi:outer membrane protein
MTQGEIIMKKMRNIMLSFSGFLLAATCLCSDIQAADTSNFTRPNALEQNRPLKIVIVNFKTCVEKSKMGQKEQSSFEALKKQMEAILSEKEKALTEVASKFNDIDYLDSLSPDAEAELKRQFRTLNQEYSSQQNQFYQSLSQTNLMVIQKLNEAITKASQDVAKKNNIDIVLNEESCFFFISSLDISDLVVRAMDEAFEKDNKEAKSSQIALPTN